MAFLKYQPKYFLKIRFRSRECFNSVGLNQSSKSTTITSFLPFVNRVPRPILCKNLMDALPPLAKIMALMLGISVPSPTAIVPIEINPPVE